MLKNSLLFICVCGCMCVCACVCLCVCITLRHTCGDNSTRAALLIIGQCFLRDSHSIISYDCWPWWFSRTGMWVLIFHNTIYFRQGHQRTLSGNIHFFFPDSSTSAPALNISYLLSWRDMCAFMRSHDRETNLFLYIIHKIFLTPKYV